MNIVMRPIGTIYTECRDIPRHWTVSDVEGTLVVDMRYLKGLSDIRIGQKIVVLFHFHRSPPFEPGFLRQTPPGSRSKRGVFSICSPKRPNPIGMSTLTVLDIHDNILTLKGLDMINGTPVLDIKPLVLKKDHLPKND